MDFLNDKHKDIYLELIENSNVNPNDVERKVLFYIISGNDDLFKKKSSVYDFDEGFINFDCLDSSTVDFCSSSKALIRLGFNLYNGYTDNYTNPLDILGKLDFNNYLIANRAINIRFKK